MEARDYCGKRYGFSSYVLGFAIGAFAGFCISEILYGQIRFNVVLAIVFGLIASRGFVSTLISNRRRQFAAEFCDYLDSISSSLSCGKNTYEAFLAADEDIRDLYKPDDPIYVESMRVADGLKSGRRIDDLLNDMAARSGNEDVKIFCDVYSICNNAGGNLKKIVNDTKATISEKCEIEAEIHTALAEPKNELRIMSVMPLAITVALKTFGDQFSGENSFAVNTIALVIFVIAYAIGAKIVDIKV